MKMILFFLSLLTFISCDTGLVPIQYGTDQCVHCSMNIMDQKFGTELITDKGKIFKFDSDECLLSYIADSKKTILKACYVTDYMNPGVLIDAKTSYFVMGGDVVSPMGGKLAAFSSKEKAQEFAKEKNAKLILWDALLKEKF